MTTPQKNSKVHGETRELLNVLLQLLDTRGSGDIDSLRRRANIASGYLDALLNVEGATLATTAENIRKHAPELFNEPTAR